MQSKDYLRRLETLLASKVAEKQAAETRRGARTLQVLTALSGAVICFFVLKGASLAYSDRPIPGPGPAEAGISGQIYHWFAGPDPVSRTLAAAIRNETGLMFTVGASAI